MRHLKYDKIPEKTPTPYVVATLLVDEINFVDYEPKPTADIRISGHVCWIGKTSAEVVVWLEQKTQGVWQRITRALFLMAGRNSINTGPAIMNPLEPTNEEERKIVMGGEERKKRRQTALSKSLFRTGPDEAEQGLIHELFLKTVDERDMLLNRRILPANCNWITDTKLNNVILCHPEDRNLHNKVFGGFLMRQALELSWNASYIYSKWKPRLLHISDIIFHRPVDVGSMLQMSAYVTYTEKNYVQILVYAEVLNQKTGKTSTTNFFNYTYEAREIVSPILPQSYHEAMMYLDGRRHFLHVMGLHRESLNNNL
ncbi:UNVERIFIED_CONTAM: hypothetical protein PYX00_002332 [Menopon gallinae]|uniref:HotDog ACOT-type domain-containing protein n=1 Tax=Menopon gallinae TaxID=328185 RepID=A0AAW2IGH5_9NEOP